MGFGHYLVDRLQKGFEADAEFQVILKTVQHDQYIDKDGSKAKCCMAIKPWVGNLSMHIKETFEMLIKIFPSQLNGAYGRRVALRHRCEDSAHTGSSQEADPLGHSSHAFRG